MLRAALARGRKLDSPMTRRSARPVPARRDRKDNTWPIVGWHDASERREGAGAGGAGTIGYRNFFVMFQALYKSDYHPFARGRSIHSHFTLSTARERGNRLPRAFFLVGYGSRSTIVLSHIIYTVEQE
jgi:hypothetical protein